MSILTSVTGPNAFGNKVYSFGGASCSFEVPQKYEVQDIVGRGAYGMVCSAVDTETGERVAIKKISRLFEDAVDGKRVLREVKLLAFLSHPNILSLKDLPRPSHPTSFADLYVITDLMDSDVQRLLRNSMSRMKAGHCQYFTVQMLAALQYCHSAGVLHRDLKPSNLLTSDDCALKLCDFGLARGIGDRMTDYVVTRWYRAPELLLVCGHYDYSADLWAAGCLAVELITGKTLFPGRDYVNQVNLIVELLGVPKVDQDFPDNQISVDARTYIDSLDDRRGKSLEEYCPELRRRFDGASFFDSYESPDQSGAAGGVSPQNQYALFEEFALGLIQYSPSKRMTAKQALNHPWLSDFSAYLHELPNESEATTRFEWKGDTSSPISTDQLRVLFLDEIEKFHVRQAASVKT